MLRDAESVIKGGVLLCELKPHNPRVWNFDNFDISSLWPRNCIFRGLPRDSRSRRRRSARRSERWRRCSGRNCSSARPAVSRSRMWARGFLAEARATLKHADQAELVGLRAPFRASVFAGSPSRRGLPTTPQYFARRKVPVIKAFICRGRERAHREIRLQPKLSCHVHRTCIAHLPSCNNRCPRAVLVHVGDQAPVT
jgi:hypothetical protein